MTVLIDERETSMADYRIILCEACGSEGRILRGHPNDPNPRDEGPCPWCEGTGGEIIETQPIELNDLELMAGATNGLDGMPLNCGEPMEVQYVDVGVGMVWHGVHCGWGQAHMADEDVFDTPEQVRDLAVIQRH